MTHPRNRRGLKVRKVFQFRHSARNKAAIASFALALFTPILATSTFAQGSAPSSSSPPATAAPSAQQLEDWRNGLRQTPPPQTGCYTSAYPSSQWQQVPCTTPPNIPYPPARGAIGPTVGNGNDVSAQVSGHISTAVGSFDSVTGVTSESGANGANSFSLQLNTNFFSGSPACNGSSNPSNCQAWEQFVYSNGGNGFTGFAFIQYWLLNFNNTCPSGWNTSGGDCWRNGNNGVQVSPQPISNLGNLSVTGQANSGGNDMITMSTGSNVFSAQNPDSILTLAGGGWKAAEFNIVGDGNGSGATFSNGSSLVVRTSVNSGNLNAPSCLGAGFTGETNNLKFGSPPVGSKPGTLPAIVFSESSSGTAGSACASSVALSAAITLGSNPFAHTHDFNGDGKSDIAWFSNGTVAL